MASVNRRRTAAGESITAATASSTGKNAVRGVRMPAFIRTG
jgi:hypothetical protein